MDAALASAAAGQAERDELWRESPALEPGCEHERELLPIIEFRQTVICRNCGGLDKDLSRRIQRDAPRLFFDPDGIIRDGTTRLARWRTAQPWQDA
jgi:hypothetical protein